MIVRRSLGFCLLLPSLAWAATAYDLAVYNVDKACHVFHMDAASGTTETDDQTYAPGGSCVTSATNGTYNGGFTLNVTGIVGASPDKAAAFNGSTGYLEMGNNSEFWPQTTSNDGWTMEFWFTPHSTSALQIITANTDATAANQGLWTAYTTAQKIRVHLHFSGGACTGQMADATTTASCAVDSICHVAVTSLGNGSSTFQNFKTYINGSLDNTISSFSGSFCSSSTGGMVFRVGQNAGNFLNATMFDEFAFYHQQLSGTQIAAHTTAGLAPPGLPNMGRRIFQSRAWKWDSPLYLPVAFGLGGMKPASITAPTFVVERMNKRAIRSPGLYEQ